MPVWPVRHWHSVSKNGHYAALFVIRAKSNLVLYTAEVGTFIVGDEESNYRLTVRRYSSTIANALNVHHGMMFSTYDRDNDNSLRNCAALFGGGFWHNDCYQCGVNLAVANYVWHGLTPTRELQSTRIWLTCN